MTAETSWFNTDKTVLMLQESSAGLQAAKGLVAMAAGQGTSDKPGQQIIIITSGSTPQEKQYLLTSGGQLVQQVVMQPPSEPVSVQLYS